MACQSCSVSVLFWLRTAQSRAPVPSPVTAKTVRTMKKDVQKSSEMSPRGSRSMVALHPGAYSPLLPPRSGHCGASPCSPGTRRPCRSLRTPPPCDRPSSVLSPIRTPFVFNALALWWFCWTEQEQSFITRRRNLAGLVQTLSTLLTSRSEIPCPHRDPVLVQTPPVSFRPPPLLTV